MPIREVPGTDLSYYLLDFDEAGIEKPDGAALLSAEIVAAAGSSVTDVFIASHGWKGDVDGAISQYDQWFPLMARQIGDRALAATKVPDFKPLIVGVHWPSLPWGNELPAGATLGADDDELAEEADMAPAELVERYAHRIATSSKAIAALETIVAGADDETTALQIQSGVMSAELEDAYRVLFAESGVAESGPAAPPGADQPAITPLETAQAWITEMANDTGSVSANAGVLGGGIVARVRDIVLAPARQLSFWTMKKRARIVGENDVHRLIRQLQAVHPAVRIHLMGHSFGCIVMTAAVAGPLSGGRLTDPLSRPVETLFLVQGAMSLWSFADEIPYSPFAPGFYRALRTQPPAVLGPVVTTRSEYDRAVGVWFPLGARIGGEQTLGVEQFPEFGGIGTHGIQGTDSAEDLPIAEGEFQYGFSPGGIYNVDASSVINKGGLFSGAHSDIVKDPVAHLFWQAALTTM